MKPPEAVELAEGAMSERAIDTALTPERLVLMYRTMVLIRRFDELTLRLRLDGQIHGVVHPYFGEEAVAVGVISALDSSDKIVSHHRGHGHCIAKGADVARMVAELLGRRDGHCRGKGGSMHIADFDQGIVGANGIVGAGLPIGAGSALASKLRGDHTLVAAFFGDGASGQGVFHEALNYSSIARLPVIWVCENNGYAADTPLERSIPIANISTLAGAYGMPSSVIDGTDILAVYRATTDAVAHTRAGNGPVFIECRVHRLGIHSQRGVPLVDKRPPELVAAARLQDPIRSFERWLVDSSILDLERIASINEEVSAELTEALTFAEASPPPDPAEAYSGAYAP